MPVGEDRRQQVVAVDQHSAFVVGGEVHRAHHPVTAARAEPSLRGGPAARCAASDVVLALEEAEHPPVVLLELVEVAVDVRGDAADRLGRRARPGSTRPRRA